MEIKFERQKRSEGRGNNQVKNWTVRHEAIVLDRIAGKTIGQIADDFNLTDSMVSLICNSKPAKELIAKVQESIYIEKYKTLPQERKDAIALAQRRMYDFLQNDTIQTSAPIASAPINIKIFEALNAADRPTSGTVINVTNQVQNNVFSDPAKRDKLWEGLQEIKEVRELHADKRLIGVSNDS